MLPPCIEQPAADIEEPEEPICLAQAILENTLFVYCLAES